MAGPPGIVINYIQWMVQFEDLCDVNIENVWQAVNTGEEFRLKALIILNCNDGDEPENRLSDGANTPFHDLHNPKA